MPFRSFVLDRSFDPEAIQRMSIAFQGVCEDLGLADKTDKATEFVAEKVIEVAKAGPCDPELLRAAVLAWIKLRH